MMNPNLKIGYYVHVHVIDYAIPSKMTIEYCYQINFGNPCFNLALTSITCDLERFYFDVLVLDRNFIVQSNEVINCTASTQSLPSFCLDLDL